LSKTFNNKTNTPLAKLRKSYLWKEYARCMVLKLTLREAATKYLSNYLAWFKKSNVKRDKLEILVAAYG